MPETRGPQGTYETPAQPAKGVGQFGHEERQCFTSDFAYTEKGSMDGTLWPQFVRKTLQPMYPDASPENPVLIKCDGGELSRLSLLSLLGFFG